MKNGVVNTFPNNFCLIREGATHSQSKCTGVSSFPSELTTTEEELLFPHLSPRVTP